MATRQTASNPAKHRNSSVPRNSGKRGALPPPKSARAQASVAAAEPPAASGGAMTALRNPFARLAAGWQAAARRNGGSLPLSTLIVSVLGLADSVYLTIEHFSQSASFACPENATINCVKVTTSPESHFLGMPVAVLGLAFFLFMVAANSPWGWRAPWAAVHWARLVSVIVGMVFVLYLIWAELFRINAICLYCTGVHILTFILFALIVAKAAFSGVGPVTD
jgi:uncharacterized membrane protein